jgi:outer membrane protein TolC
VKSFYRLSIALTGCLASPLALSQAEPASLDPQQVLVSSRAHFPEILETLARRRAVAGSMVEAEGAFDLVFEAEGFGRASGFYDGTVLSGGVKQPFRNFGGSVYSGYAISRGDFPIYEDEYFTSLGGKLKAGVVFSLLRDRLIDERRFGVTDARLAARAADFEVLATQVGVQQRALVTYWRWVTAGQNLAVYEELLRNAASRESALARQVARGARAEIFLTENRQNIIRRMSLVTAARRDFQSLANELAFYYRDDNGQPIVPDARLVPPSPTPESLNLLAVTDAVSVSEAVARRPELRLLHNGIERLRQRMLLQENALKPRLDLGLELSQGLGGEGQGGRSRDSTDTIIGFTFSMPFQQRRERGSLSRSRAELDAREYQRQAVEEQMAIELENILLDLSFAQALVQLAAEEVGQAVILRDAEQRRFESGASDFFLVNVREETAADARVRFYTAALETRIARANYDAATLDLERLGLPDGAPATDLPRMD